jgi:mannosylglycoprotein endo-beta-mannosidase
MQKHEGVILKIDFEKAYDSIRFDFVEEVMTRKGFDQKLRGWIMNNIQGGRVYVNINGKNGPYFRTYRWVQQGDPCPH